MLARTVTLSVALAAMLAAAGCGQGTPSARPHDPAAVILLLERDGYRPPALPKPPPGATLGTWSLRLEPRYGTAVANLRRASLDVVVARGTSATTRVPEALWLRTGTAIVLGYPASPAGLAQWAELEKEL